MMPSRRQFLTALGVAGTVGLAGCEAIESRYSPGTNDESEWPMPAYDRGFSGYNPDAATPRDGVTERWATAINHPAGRPVVAAGRVLVPTMTGLVAFDLETGDELWRYGDEQPWPTAPVVHDGTVYVGFADQTTLVALDVENGALQWRTETRGSIQATPTFDLGFDALYAGDDTGSIYQIDPATGDVVLRGEVFGPVTAVAHSRTLLVGTEGGEVYSLFPHHDVLTGLWRRNVGGAVTSLSIARDGSMFVGTFGGPVYRLQDGAHAGTSRWEAERGAIHVAATGGDVVGCDGGGIRTFDARTGTRGWNRDGNYDVSPAIAGDTVIVGGGERGADGAGFVTAYALSGGTSIGPLQLGGKRWQHEVASSVLEGVAVADGAVFAVTQGNDETPPRIHALDAA